MADIIGMVGTVVYVKSKSVTVEVHGRQFDFHPDLLKRKILQNNFNFLYYFNVLKNYLNMNNIFHYIWFVKSKVFTFFKYYLNSIKNS